MPQDSRDLPRNAAVDHLRILLTALVILHHAAIVYGGSGGWYWRQEPDSSNSLLLLFNAVNQSFFMGAFFLLAGYYTPPAYARKGVQRFLDERFQRLAIPLVFYFFVLSPLTIALARMGEGHSFWSGWWLMTRQIRFEPGPLWFAEALLLFTRATPRGVCGAGRRPFRLAGCRVPRCCCWRHSESD
jgi:fucose 4-O-acetylase-like acetyltransferase